MKTIKKDEANLRCLYVAKQLSNLNSGVAPSPAEDATFYIEAFLALRRRDFTDNCFFKMALQCLWRLFQSGISFCSIIVSLVYLVFLALCPIMTTCTT